MAVRCPKCPADLKAVGEDLLTVYTTVTAKTRSSLTRSVNSSVAVTSTIILPSAHRLLPWFRSGHQANLHRADTGAGTARCAVGAGRAGAVARLTFDRPRRATAHATLALLRRRAARAATLGTAILARALAGADGQVNGDRAGDAATEVIGTL